MNTVKHYFWPNRQEMQAPLSSIVEIYKQRFQVGKPHFSQPPARDLCLIITIPAYREPDIIQTLKSLADCQPPSGSVEIIITVNAPEDAPEHTLAMNQRTVEQIRQWEGIRPAFLTPLIIRNEDIAKKHAGAGTARKIGMDEAVQRWAMANKDGPVVCLDADCLVSENYLTEAEKAFSNPSIRAGHFYFEHVYRQEPDSVLRQGIVHYELHLRCYIQGLKRAGYPFACYTVGSCMAVRASVYARAGGMNRRTAGEDFYFLHKVIPSGGWRDMVEATVFPSCRASDRVPFGTGRAQVEWRGKKKGGLTYNAGIYEVLSSVFETAPRWYDEEVTLDFNQQGVKDFLLKQDIFMKIEEMKKYTTTADTFLKRFWQWMDGFRVLRFVHYLRDHGFQNQPVRDVANILLRQSGQEPAETVEDVLDRVRRLEKL